MDGNELTNNLCNTKEGCYVLGFIWADGHISKKYHKVSIDLVKSDGELIFEIFKNFSFKKYNKKNYQRKDGINRKEQIIISLYDEYISSFFKENDYMLKSGISPDKILTRIRYLNYWLRGYFDGDGSLHIRCRNSIYNCSLQFSSTIEQDWNFLNTIVLKLKLFSFKIVRRETSKGNSSVYKTESIFEAKKMLEFIYSNENEWDGIGLERKYYKYIELKNIKRIRKSKYEKF